MEVDMKKLWIILLTVSLFPSYGSAAQEEIRGNADVVIITPDSVEASDKDNSRDEDIVIIAPEAQPDPETLYGVGDKRRSGYTDDRYPPDEVYDTDAGISPSESAYGINEDVSGMDTKNITEPYSIETQ
jgi:hypothetical protein